ncbi:MAG: T9SS type A sorting domain-containing protein [Bacteroidales bacterium]|nr:T9SS type A sorting domain-containing protein [Candidatus Colimorpha onthohippi]
MKHILTLLLGLLTFVVLLGQNATASTTNTTDDDASITPDEILFWVGNGTHSVIFTTVWADSALAWGYRFDGDSVSIQQIMDDIAANDYRFQYTASNWGIADIFFDTGFDTLSLSNGNNNYWWLNVNHISSNLGYDAQMVGDGDIIKIADSEVGIVTDSAEYGGFYYPTAAIWTTPIYPVSIPPLHDATISASRIQFWVGSGQNRSILILSWAQPDTALAWGVQFDGESISLTDALDSIKRYDYRFSYEGNITDFHFTNGDDTIGVVSAFNIMFNVNGITASDMASSTYLHPDDVAKVGDMASMITTDSMEWAGVYYATAGIWTTPVHAVNPTDSTSHDTSIVVHGPFCGKVGTPNCNAIAADSSAVVAWATTCVVHRGPIDIARTTIPASYGNDTMATGPVSMTNNINVVSLGDGGSAVLTFGGEIYNGNGPDFAVYENSFDDDFLELAFVEVSSDGIHYVRFPSTSLTQTETQIDGFGIIDPTMINNLAGKYRMGYGTPFDLEALRDSANIDINHISHIRLIDVVGTIDSTYGSRDAYGHIINDPYPTDFNSCGFDLAGVGVMHINALDIKNATTHDIAIYPNPVTNVLNITTTTQTEASLYDIQGKKMLTQTMTTGLNQIDIQHLKAGIYLLHIGQQNHKILVQH